MLFDLFNSKKSQERVISFILSVAKNGMKQFPFEKISNNQKLEIFLFDVWFIRNKLYIQGIGKDCSSKIFESINSEYKTMNHDFGFVNATELIEVRSPFYVNDIAGLLNSDYPKTKMYMPYGLYFL